MAVVVRKPSDCSTSELNDFYDLAGRGGEVTPHGLKKRISRAKILAFVRVNEATVGIAALKCPNDSYRKRCFAKSKSNLDSKEFPYELGWVFVEKSYRGNKLSLKLVRQLMNSCEDQNIYATSRETNRAMHRTLRKCGFAKVGIPWPKENSDENLVLFVRQR